MPFSPQQQLHRALFDVHAVGNQLGMDFGGSEDRPDDTGVAVREGPHGVVGVRGASRSARDGKPRLLVIGIRMAHRNNQAGFARRFDARGCSEHLGSDGNQAGLSFRSLEKALEQSL